MKKIVLILTLLSVFLVGCSNDDKDSASSNSTSEEQKKFMTTRDYQEVFNTLVDNNLSFMELLNESEDFEETSNKAEDLKKEIGDMINEMESKDSENQTAKDEVLSLARSYEKYYGFVINKNSDKATEEVTLAVLAVPTIADKVFSGELPPKYKSLE